MYQYKIQGLHIVQVQARASCKLLPIERVEMCMSFQGTQRQQVQLDIVSLTYLP